MHSRSKGDHWGGERIDEEVQTSGLPGECEMSTSECSHRQEITPTGKCGLEVEGRSRGVEAEQDGEGG